MKKLTLIYLFLSSLSAISQGNLYSFQEDKKTGYIDSLGNVVIHAQFDRGYHFSEGLAAVHQNGKVGYIDLKGNMIIEAKFDHGFLFKEGVAIVKVDSLYGLINCHGQYILKPIYQYIQFQNEGKIGIKRNNLWGFYTIKGKKVTPIQYDWIGQFSEGFAMVKSRYDYKYGFIDEDGKTVIPLTLSMINSNFHQGFASVNDSVGKCFINKQGKNVFQKQYYNTSGFSNGRAFVQDHINTKGYFIDTNGKQISDTLFTQSWGFNEGFCGASTDSEFVIIDTTGTIIFRSKTIELRFYSGEFGLFCDHSHESLTWGIMNKKQEIISNERFTTINILPEGKFAETYSGDPAKWYGYGKRGYVDIHGNSLWREE